LFFGKEPNYLFHFCIAKNGTQKTTGYSKHDGRYDPEQRAATMTSIPRRLSKAGSGKWRLDSLFCSLTPSVFQA